MYMKVTENIQKMCYEVYCDTDKEYHLMHQLKERDLNPNNLMKCYLNSVYGKVVMDMNKDYIVVHENISDGTSTVAILFKSHICGVHKHCDGTADILLDSGACCYSIDKYEDIIKQLI